ncbi:MAG: DUF4465 domain-containing protein [Verrucomicrobiaceae bacterium]|nr:MAG: DUF4465 domain-containing protein [Verrucomicrobiaceae bacterium]
MKIIPIGVSAIAGIGSLFVCPASAAVATFETFSLSPESHWDGSDLSGTAGVPGFFGEIAYTQNRQIEGSGFRNTYTDWGSWTGFAISNHTDTITPGPGNQYSAITGGGASGSANYAVGYYSTYETSTNVTLGALTNLSGLGASFTNTTYATLDMLSGSTFGKKFGGVSGNDADWFKLTISGYAGGVATGSFIDFYLADFRFADNSFDYLVDEWTYVDFSPLGSVDELRFSMSSSDNGGSGMNTPSYFAMDNFLAVPEPSSLLLGFAGLGLFLRRKR